MYDLAAAYRRFSALAALLLVVAAPACEGPANPDNHDDNLADYVWQSGGALPILYDLNAAWADGLGGIVAVGNDGVAVRYDGNTWQEYYTRTARDLWSVWGAPTGEVFAVGDLGVIRTRASPEWNIETSPTTENLRGVWGASANNVFAVGVTGVILHWDGSAWTKMDSPTPQALFSVWGTSGYDVYAVGLEGAIVHYDGVAWSTMESGTSETLAGVCGASNVVMAVGNNGVALRRVGDGPWEPIDTHSQDVLQAVWMAGSNAAFAVGGNGTTLRYDGADWSTMESPPAEWLFGLTGTGADDVTAVGSHTMLRYDGDHWSAATRGAVSSLRDVWCSDSGDAIAVGVDGNAFRRTGDVWTTMEFPTNRNMFAVFGTPDGHVFAAGFGGYVLHYDGSSWKTELNLGVSYYDIWGTSATEVWVVGDQGRIIRRSAGGQWSTEPTTTSRGLRGIWGESPDHIFAVGQAGEIVELKNNVWTRLPPVFGYGLYDVAGYRVRKSTGEWSIDVVAVGSFGASVERGPDTDQFVALDTGVSEELYAVAAGGNNVVYAVGSGGTILSLYDHEWRVERSPTTENLFGISSPRKGELFAVGGTGDLDGTVLFYGPE
jgi:hypothetical protein